MSASLEQIGKGYDKRLREKAEIIRKCARKTVDAILETGRHLSEARSMVPHGYWGDWLKEELNWSEDTALRFINVYDALKSEALPDLNEFKSRTVRDLNPFKSDTMSDLNIDASALYLLARPSTPLPVRAKLIEQAKAGEHITLNSVREALPQSPPTAALRRPPFAELPVSPEMERNRRQAAYESLAESSARLLGKTLKDVREEIDTSGLTWDQWAIAYAKLPVEDLRMLDKVIEQLTEIREGARKYGNLRGFKAGAEDRNRAAGQGRIRSVK